MKSLFILFALILSGSHSFADGLDCVATDSHQQVKASFLYPGIQILLTKQAVYTLSVVSLGEASDMTADLKLILRKANEGRASFTLLKKTAPAANFGITEEITPDENFELNLQCERTPRWEGQDTR